MSRPSSRSLRGLVAVGATLSFALSLGACGSVTAADTASALTDSSTTTAALSPLEQRLGFSSDENKRQQQLVGLHRQADDQVVACMAAQGFDYIPNPINETLLTGEAAADGTRLWAEQNGLGITQAFLVARETIDSQGEQIDLNADYLESLPPIRAQQFLRALFGDVPEAGGENQPLAYEPRGCQGEAFATVFAQFEALDEFVDELESLNSRVKADPRVLSHMGGWSTCMEERGFRYLDQDEMADDVYARLLTIDAFTDDTAQIDASTGELGELLAFERTIAVASFDCSRSFSDALKEIRAVYESEFIEDNRLRIDALAGND